MTTLCDPCREQVNAWIDAFQGFGPIGRWRQFNVNPKTEYARSAEMRRALVDDRAALIRHQISVIRQSCHHGDSEVAA